jgi:class 3 adenylate cyclase
VSATTDERRFLDITGYMRLTQERGDEAAASLAARLNRLVNRSSVEHGGRAVKWLGDGVMLYFRDPGPGVVAALEMVDGVSDAGLPPLTWACTPGRSSSRRVTTSARR